MDLQHQAGRVGRGRQPSRRVGAAESVAKVALVVPLDPLTAGGPERGRRDQGALPLGQLDLQPGRCRIAPLQRRPQMGSQGVPPGGERQAGPVPELGSAPGVGTARLRHLHALRHVLRLRQGLMTLVAQVTARRRQGHRVTSGLADEGWAPRAAGA